jgi:hypothetical protein
MRPARFAGLALLGFLAVCLGGCASEASYPVLPGLGGLGQKTLTPEEQQAKIKELASAQGAAASAQPAVMTQPAPAQ